MLALRVSFIFIVVCRTSVTDITSKECEQGYILSEYILIIPNSFSRGEQDILLDKPLIIVFYMFSIRERFCRLRGKILRKSTNKWKNRRRGTLPLRVLTEGRIVSGPQGKTGDLETMVKVRSWGKLITKSLKTLTKIKGYFFNSQLTAQVFFFYFTNEQCNKSGI